MPPLSDEELIDTLIGAAYDSGYYSGQKRDGSPEHQAATGKRNRLKREVLERMSKLSTVPKPHPASLETWKGPKK
jgi:hypothetical protein